MAGTSLAGLGAGQLDPNLALLALSQSIAASGGNTTINFAMGEINVGSTQNATNTTTNTHNQHAAPSIPREAMEEIVKNFVDWFLHETSQQSTSQATSTSREDVLG